ncbi:hypothetical protein [Aerosakkonema funiforme]|uniref:JAB domain-containing protein n=1 Tax=Aerosakkonema funiforme FACHB-1375 TaxID=2949571 RepID=A0A926VIH6_9CYAN|nr:hypothetical protein [Aerosakkonema funiforme]MBD2183738.1 hypothetical protein [Aerosakkonema funiforme FACHB-1375]
MSGFLRLLGIGTNDSRFSNLNVTVEIYETVIARITHAVSRSDREEGGKLIGKISENGNQLKITVETYIDSGPRVNNSIGHLMPDGEYQEAMFRVLEKFDPDIHYLGSWHTHHCNDLPELSPGDIRSYKETLNSRNYNLDYFFALLVTALRGSKTQNLYYLFFREQEHGYELNDSLVHTVSRISPLDSILKNAEEVAFAHRRNRTLYSNNVYGTKSRASQIDTGVDPLEKIRSEDQQWILGEIPWAKPRQSKKDGSIYWQWQMDSNVGKLDVYYKHPSNSPSIPAYLEILFEGKQIISEHIPLNDSRFQKIKYCLDRAIEKTK